MKKRMIQIGIVVVLICFFIVFMQIKESPKTLPVIHPNQPTQYTLSDVIQVFDKHHINLNPVIETKNTSFEINKVPPYIYTIQGNKKCMLFIYKFDSVADRQKAKEFYQLEFKNIFPSGFFSLRVYETWNLLMLEMITQPIKMTALKDIKQHTIDQIVFKNLNHGKVKRYKGESMNWEGTYTLKYYKHHWVSKEGLDLNDNSVVGQFVIHYKPKMNVQNIECEYKYGSHTSKMSVGSLDNEGNITMNVYNADVPDPSNPPAFTLKTDNKAETMTFKEK